MKKIKADIASGRIRSPRQLSQYIAASTILHCADGWSYLGKSIACLTRGDPHRARHLAYYAELRAALSLLASEGMGIFQNQHFVLDGQNSVSRLHTGHTTHQVVWNCLEYWAGQRKSGNLFANVVKPYGRSLDEWLTPLGGSRIVAPQVRAWFRQWGFDLKALADDRNARNASSYRPDGIPIAWRVRSSETLKFARDIWAAFEPAPNSIFETIDAHILRIALESTFQGINPAMPFADWVTTAVSYEGLSEDTERYWIRFLTREINGEDACILSYSKEPSQSEQTGHLGIMSRAALLLRIATGSAGELLRQAGFSADSIAFWWESLGQARGLWDGNREGSLTDLWADVAPLLQDIAAFQERYQEEEQTFFRTGRELGSVLVGLGSCERVAIWSLTPPE